MNSNPIEGRHRFESRACCIFSFGINRLGKLNKSKKQTTNQINHCRSDQVIISPKPPIIRRSDELTSLITLCNYPIPDINSLNPYYSLTELYLEALKRFNRTMTNSNAPRGR